MKRMFSAIKRELWGCPVERAYHQMTRVKKRHAELQGELTVHTSMHSFYVTQLGGIDPNTHWWEWARAKEAEKRAWEDMRYSASKAAEADARSQAISNKYKTLRKNRESES